MAVQAFIASNVKNNFSINCNSSTFFLCKFFSAKKFHPAS